MNFSYRFVKYEDLALNTETILRQLYQFVEVPYSPLVQRYMLSLKNGSRTSEKSFFGVIRSSNFDFDHWKKEMKKGKIMKIERLCKDFMMKMNYSSAFPNNTMI